MMSVIESIEKFKPPIYLLSIWEFRKSQVGQLDGFSQIPPKRYELYYFDGCASPQKLVVTSDETELQIRMDLLGIERDKMIFEGQHYTTNWVFGNYICSAF